MGVTMSRAAETTRTDDPSSSLLEVTPQTRGPRFSLSRKSILLASDGSAVADTATRVAGALAAYRGAEPHVLCVENLSTPPLPPPTAATLALPHEMAGSGICHDDLRTVRRHLASVLGG